MNTFIYYVRSGSSIVGTVAFCDLLNGQVARGIAITGQGQTPSRKIGRLIAENRLQLAMNEQMSCRPINFKREAAQRFAGAFEGATPDTTKCAYGVDPTPTEQRILERNRE